MTNHPNDIPGSDTPLDSWKEIAAYLQRDVSTAMRWEKSEELPVHRHQHSSRASVYAFTSELDAWKAARKPQPGESRPWSRWVPALAGGLALLAVAAVVQWGPILNPPDPLTEAAEASGIVVRQISGDRYTGANGTPSPDGRYLSSVDWETGDVAIRDLESGRIRRITNKGTWEENGDEYGGPSAISPDGTKLAFTWENYKVNNPYGFGELKLASFDETSATEPKILYRSEEVIYVRTSGWSPDGKHVLVQVTRKDRTNQIGLVSAVGGSLQVLKTMDWRSLGRMAFSPDGKYIVYDFPVREDSPERDIFLLAADGSGETTLIEHPANDYVLDWTPDGEGILFASDRTGTWDVWLVAVKDARPDGPTQRLKRAVGRIQPLGFTRQGAFYYGLRTGNNDVYLADLDPETGNVKNSPARISRRLVGTNRGPSWSPDGRQLAFVSSQTLPGPAVPGELTLVIRSLQNGRDREVPLQMASVWRNPRWSPDGRFLVGSGRNEKGRAGVYHIDSETGDITTIVSFGPDERSVWADWSPDGKAVFYTVHHNITRARRIMRMNLDSGERRRIHEDSFGETSGQDGAVSPDGRWVAISYDRAALRIVSAEGGESRELFRGKDGERVFGIAWTPDSRQVIFSAGRFPKRKLWRAPLGGGEALPMGVEMNWLAGSGISVHPDGRRIAFHATDGPDRYSSELWVMENFLPETRAGK